MNDSLITKIKAICLLSEFFSVILRMFYCCLVIKQLFFLKMMSLHEKPVNLNGLTCIVMQEASDAHSKTADSDTVSTYQVSSVQLVTDKKLEAFNKA